ncbi:MAG TPA: phenylalanine--tRNA ligase subunit beta, partial [Gammaproteobacteria bacterium]|nr:phenylalanine--tRNA ligase subunit beta [Gammaproteobacteria bacterium]
MKFNLDWLKKLVTVKSSAQQLAEKITDAGLEVESLENDVIELKIPPNRADCLGMVGLAREVAAVTGEKFSEPNVKPVPATIKDQITLKVQDSAACPKYLGRIIKGIDNTKQTPQWIKDCLTTADIKSISPVVDITNYILLEWGQPLHAFNVQKLHGDVIVRKAKPGEELQLLDDTTVKLTPQTLVIADNNKPLALAGIKGGKESGIETDTTDVLLECAYFEPVGVRLTSRNLGVKSDGSYRFERCVDPNMQEKVMEQLTQMLLDVVGGKAGPVVTFIDEKQLPKTTVLSLHLSRIQKLLGVHIETATVINILQRLGFQVETHNGDEELMITVPSFRPDIVAEI